MDFGSKNVFAAIGEAKHSFNLIEQSDSNSHNGLFSSIRISCRAPHQVHPPTRIAEIHRKYFAWKQKLEIGNSDFPNKNELESKIKTDLNTKKEQENGKL